MPYTVLIKLKEVQSKTKLAKILLLYPGDFDHGIYGKFKVTEKHLEQAVKNFNAKIGTRLNEDGNPILPGNYQHSSYNENPEYAKACGWGFKLKVEDGKLYGLIEWTEKAKEYIQAKEFQFISPEFDFDWEDEHGVKCGFTILGFALTNVNFLKKEQLPVTLTDFNLGDFEKWIGNAQDREQLMYAFTNVENWFYQYFYAQINSGEIATVEQLLAKLKSFHDEFANEINNQFETVNNGDYVMNDNLKKLLKLSDDSDGVKEVTQLIDQVKILSEQVKQLTDAKKEIETEKEKIAVQLTDEGKEKLQLVERVTNLEKTIKLRNAEDYIGKAVFNENTMSGKIIPAQKDIWLQAYLANPEQTKKLIEGMPMVIQAKEHGSNGVGREPVPSNPATALHEKALELQEKNSDLSYDMALAKAQKENPELNRVYMNQTNQ